MNTGLIILFIFIGIIVGIVVTLITVAIIKNRNEVAGTLMVCKRSDDTTQSGFNNPDIWFQISNPHLIFDIRKRHVLLRVKYVKHDDKNDRLIDISQN